MKKNNLLKGLCVICTPFILSACSDKKDPEPTFDLPTITISSPADLSDLEAIVNEPLSFQLAVEAEAGLSKVSVSINGTKSDIKIYAAEKTSEEIAYDFLAADDGENALIFTVEDAMGRTVSTNEIAVTASGSLGYLLADLAGLSSSNSDVILSEWDTRTKYIFGITSSLETEASIEIPNNQGQITFASDNPDANDDQKVIKIIRAPKDGFANWGGYVNAVFGFDNNIPEDQIGALPAWNTSTNSLDPGTKVVAVDVYYDDTADSNFDWAGFTALPKNLWEEGDPSMGYPLLLTLGKYSNVSVSPDASGYYIAYHAYLTKANEWQTVIFDKEASGRIANFYAVGDESKNPAAPSEVDCVVIAPARSYVNSVSVDINPIYFKNLRIIDKE